MINPIVVINQVFELQQKIAQNGLTESFERNFNRLYTVFEEEGFLLQDPTGESYSETRADYEASISGRVTSSMTIIRTIKPIIYHRKDGQMLLVQKGVVIAENK